MADRPKFDLGMTFGPELTCENLEVRDSLLQWHNIIQAAAQTVEASEDDPSTTMFFPVTAGRLYALESLLLMSCSDAAGDAEFTFAVDVGSMNGRGSALGFTAADVPSMQIVNANLTSATNQVVVGTQSGLDIPCAVPVWFSFKPSNTTTFRLKFGNFVQPAPGRFVRLLGGSWMRWRLLP